MSIDQNTLNKTSTVLLTAMKRALDYHDIEIANLVFDMPDGTESEVPFNDALEFTLSALQEKMEVEEQ